ncbi:hypothetical protein VFPPC_18303 [Pochonia chlamydosporia 170]|uniref:Uncharacterized protein n=1 Tax=Pochonia chlamydosporia 170 TaxID=1380566 RepID=A0A219AQI1_METCM|nr:hypothetical protein VFPPC_18303 [Pochonia chlamydosporia 170]OWT42564.1 hypothetical protein VFPPC_18303 [Pochonia chlamydosporia 170]
MSHLRKRILLSRLFQSLGLSWFLGGNRIATETHVETGLSQEQGTEGGRIIQNRAELGAHLGTHMLPGWLRPNKGISHILQSFAQLPKGLRPRRSVSTAYGIFLGLKDLSVAAPQPPKGTDCLAKALTRHSEEEAPNR